MKRLFLAVLCTMFSVAAFAQAKKPTIMVVPADQWCLENGYYDEVNDDGQIKKVVSYEKALADRSLNQVIIAMGNEMVDRSFPLVDLNATMKDIELNSALDGDDVMMSRIDRILNQAKADIMLEVSWYISETRPDVFSVNFNIKGMDAYTRKQVAGCDIISKESGSVDFAMMLKQANANSFGPFCDRLDMHFADMAQNGREVSFDFVIKPSADVTFDDEVGSNGDFLGDVIYDWFQEATVSGRFSSKDSEYRLEYTQVRIPLYDDRGRAIDARRFINPLVKKLRGDEYGISNVKIITIGLGKCRIEIG